MSNWPKNPFIVGDLVECVSGLVCDNDGNKYPESGKYYRVTTSVVNHIGITGFHEDQRFPHVWFKRVTSISAKVLY